jgi:hypothetical protein
MFDLESTSNYLSSNPYRVDGTTGKEIKINAFSMSEIESNSCSSYKKKILLKEADK